VRSVPCPDRMRKQRPGRKATMGLYDRYVLPHMIELAMRQRPIMRQRQKVVPLAEGRVLEVGVGTGLNLSYYDPARVSGVWALDPAPALRGRAAQRASLAQVPVEVLALRGEEIPMDTGSFDTVVMTYTLCSIEDRMAALAQMRRVLRPGGRLLFAEHGLAPDAAVARWQARLNPIWSAVGGGCHLDVPVPTRLEEAGFSLIEIGQQYLPGPRALNYNYWGVATPR